MLRTFKTEAIVFKKRSLLNKDTLVTLFTEKYGKINVTAYGIKKITSRRLPHNETGNLLKAIIYKKNNRFYLQETQLTSVFSQIKKDRQKINYLYFLFFILDRLLPENQEEIAIYNITKQFLIEISKSPTFNEQKLGFYLNTILIVLGYIEKKKPLEELITVTEEIIGEKLPAFVI